MVAWHDYTSLFHDFFLSSSYRNQENSHFLVRQVGFLRDTTVSSPIRSEKGLDLRERQWPSDKMLQLIFHTLQNKVYQCEENGKLILNTCFGSIADLSKFVVLSEFDELIREPSKLLRFKPKDAPKQCVTHQRFDFLIRAVINKRSVTRSTKRPSPTFI